MGGRGFGWFISFFDASRPRCTPGSDIKNKIFAIFAKFQANM
jgi:hypothetical protein